MMRKIPIFLLLFSFFLCSEEPAYLFSGKHFVASYLQCDKNALQDIARLQEVMDQAVAASNAQILNRCSYTFEGNGFTALYLLSESHASIHTYPEFNACFVDLFTCGSHCSATNFDKILKDYLQPQEVSDRFFLRNESIEEIPFH